MRNRLFSALASMLLTSALTACGGGGGGGGGGPGDSGTGTLIVPEAGSSSTPAGATDLPLGVYGTGDLRTPNDVDYWRFAVSAGEDVRIDLLAARIDPAEWAPAGYPPRIRILDVSGAIEFRRHAPTRWTRGRRDLDFPHWIAPADGQFLIEVASDGRPGGPYAVRVTLQATLALATEMEPPGMAGLNDADATAEPLLPGSLVAGWAEPGTDDRYTFALTEDSLVSVEVWMGRLGIPENRTAYAEPSVQITGGGDPIVAVAQLVGDPGFAMLREAGTYVVRVRPNPGGEGDYLLAVEAEPFAGTPESEPNDTPQTADDLVRGRAVVGKAEANPDFFRIAAQAGDLIELELFDRQSVDGMEVTATLLAPDGLSIVPTRRIVSHSRILALARESGLHTLRLEGPSPYLVRLRAVRSATAEVEPNDTPEQGTAIAIGAAAGAMDVPGDVDCFRFRARAGRLTRVRLVGGVGASGGDTTSHLGSLLDPRLTVLDPDGQPVVMAEDPLAGPADTLFPEGLSDTESWLTLGFVPTVGGTYTVRVEDIGSRSGPTRFYWLEVR
jgi:hypothetical protein